MVCKTTLEVGAIAFWNAEAKTVTCLGCLDTSVPLQESGSTDPSTPPLERGTAGGSARRRYERLHERREREARDRYGRLSGAYLALTHDPPSTVAWARGSRGERLLGQYLESLHDARSVIVLHDRRIPRSRANIDHIAVTRSGRVWAIDAKTYTGKVQRVDKGRWFSTDFRLYIGRRDCTRLVHGMSKQVEAIRAALGLPLIEEFGVEVRAGLCFVDAEWSLFAKPFDLNNVWIGWPKALGQCLSIDGELAPEHLLAVSQRVAEALPPA